MDMKKVAQLLTTPTAEAVRQQDSIALELLLSTCGVDLEKAISGLRAALCEGEMINLNEYQE